MANAPKSKADVLYEAIDQEAADEPERSDSKLLYQALNERRGELSGSAHIPAEDKGLSEKIMAQARSRSEQISRSRMNSSSNRLSKSGRPIPWWLIFAWLLALGAVVAYFLFVR
jgi:hypothetical protein